MTVYSTTITTGPSDAAGNTEMSINETSYNHGTFASSEDAPSVGFIVQDAYGRNVTISDDIELEDSHVVNIHGLPMSVKQARELGFGDMLSSKALDSAEAVKKLAETGKFSDEADPQEDTGREMAQAVEAGLTSYEEANAGSSIADTLALHVPELQHADQLVADVIAGEVEQEDWQALRDRGIGREALQATVSRAVDLGREAAASELGSDRFNTLARWASESRAIYELVRHHGMQRAMGKAKSSWNDVYKLAQQHRAR